MIFLQKTLRLKTNPEVFGQIFGDTYEGTQIGLSTSPQLFGEATTMDNIKFLYIGSPMLLDQIDRYDLVPVFITDTDPEIVRSKLERSVMYMTNMVTDHNYDAVMDTYNTINEFLVSPELAEALKK